jgi:hypothetical protein
LKLEKEIRELTEQKSDKAKVEQALEKETQRRQELETSLRMKLEEIERLKNANGALMKRFQAERRKNQENQAQNPPSDAAVTAEVKKARRDSQRKSATIKTITESMTKLEQEIRNAEETRLRNEEEKVKLIKEKNEAQTMIKIVEANLKLKTFAIETLRQRLGQLLIDIGAKQKLKPEKIRAEILTVQEEFLKLKTEFEVQMKWIAASASQEVNNKPLDLTMIPQAYRHLFSQSTSQVNLVPNPQNRVRNTSVPPPLTSTQPKTEQVRKHTNYL